MNYTNNGFRVNRSRLTNNFVITISEGCYEYLKETFKNELPKEALLYNNADIIFVIDKDYSRVLNELMLKTVGWAIPSYI